MKKIIISFFVSVLISISSYAQQGINYKALIKDDYGNVLVNTNNISVQFTIYEGAALTNQVYQETHTNVSTDANGILISTIGGGNTSDVFSDISWGNDEHWLNVQIDIGDGLVDVSTTQFMAVPYALRAGNVNGLERVTDSIDSGTGLPIYGWRLIGRNPDNYGNIGLNSTDLSYNEISSATRGATGDKSLAAGYQTTASADHTTAMGYLSTASSRQATALGYNTTASGIGSTAIGWQSTASAFASTSMGLYTRALGHGSLTAGNNTEAHSYVETVIGQRNTIYTPNSTSEWNLADRLFVIGNGLPFGDDPRSDALIVLKNGTITAPSFDLSEITDDKALITKEYADENLGGSGLEKITENNGNQDNTGWRLTGMNPNNYGAIGDGAIDFSVNSNYPSTTEGATGVRSLAFGSRTTAPSIMETALGNYNVPYTPVGVNHWVATDRLFSIGNGTTNPSNALIILKNGKITAPSFDISEITDDKALITREYYYDKLSNGSSGLERIEIEGAGFGWRLKDMPDNYYGDIGNYSVDLSQQWGNSERGATGDYSTALGWVSHSEGDFSISIGFSNHSVGEASMALGDHTTATAYGSTTVGTYNVGGGNPNFPIATDPLFEVGNGTISTPSNALTVLKNGTITAPSLTNSLINTAGDKSLITKEYFDTNTSEASSGLELYTDNEGNTGRHFVGSGQSPWIGNDAVDFSMSNQVSPRTGALGTRSFSTGNQTRATADNSVSMGNETIASGTNSFAVGNNTIASGDNSLALGEWNDEDPSAILLVGNGTTSNGNTAFKIMDTGNAVFDGEIQHTSTGSANMIPIAYGTVESNGNVLSGTNNFTATVNANVFSITVTGETLSASNSSCSIVPYSTAPRTSSIIHSGGDLRVYIFNSSGTQVASTFQFVIYKL